MLLFTSESRAVKSIQMNDRNLDGMIYCREHHFHILQMVDTRNTNTVAGHTWGTQILIQGEHRGDIERFNRSHNWQSCTESRFIFSIFLSQIQWEKASLETSTEPDETWIYGKACFFAEMQFTTNLKPS
jgi:hypothetical protein